ncbi:MAG: ABC transporter ATP-binding protein [Gemmatimonadota bacterium]|jgi:subfamily B ATP-binding cassette protein MsbA
MKQYLRILGYLRPYQRLFLLSVVAMVLYGALDAGSLTLLIPFLNVLFGNASGGLFQGHTMVHRILRATIGGLLPADAPLVGLRNVMLVLFVVLVVKNLVQYLQLVLVVTIDQHVTRDMRDEIYDNLLTLDLAFFHRTKSGQIISRLTNDVDQMRSLVTANLAKALSNSIQVLFLIATMLMISWKLTLITLIAVPLMVGLWNHFRERLRVGVLKVWDAVGELASHIQETVGGIRLVKAAGAEAWETNRFRALTRQYYKAMVRNERWRQLFPPATEVIIAVAVLVLLWFGGRMVILDRSLGASAFLAFAGIAMRMQQPVKWLGQFPSLVQPGLVAAGRAFELLDAQPEIVNRPDARPVSTFRDAIRFEDVTFGYGTDEPAVRDVDLEIGHGQVVALVGPSGAGKTTLANLVPRFYDPTAGRITLDGVDLRQYRVQDLRSLMGIVTQETILFHDTVRANIAYGLDSVQPAALEEAAKAANAHEFIMDLPAGYDTLLGERGTRISGGQRQRIAIARALLRNTPILILDEATSALDTESERLVQAAIERLMEDRTVLVIAHRLSTVRRAHAIVVLDDGRIVERGRHDELLAINGVYRRLYRLQFESMDAADLQAPAG